jgi:Rieske Fe-S protein
VEPECLTFKEDRLIIDLENTATLRENGQAAYADYPEKDVRMIVIRMKKNRYYALSRLCTHGGQALSYIPERKLVQCNSYNHSLFNLDGTVWKGPAPEPIRSYELIARKGVLEILI